ncbi:NAD(P)(+) transhydrogenase (Re/Si-specific) subunit beta [Egibacter rhizosphaerae]|uniref:NAD(P) transhydrogenase subunit beta n=1 Tax=Egibacter rhizosphaerae TaxID=1670831 RepID=A0A411YE78_9ACTN|nr:NAD(P)(+) transhydrogenase (Re/Si-specific) subunit beta [Egibacter rhizosphaerae]QBI19519.1 NAD(P)(+) transhydrogenase (Re/Si-specific) subunit beta [Egibacter rhizosphaerae]
MTGDLIALAALASIALFVVGLKRLSKIRTARSGNLLIASGMLLAVVITLVEQGLVDYRWIAGGLAVGAVVGVLIVVRAKATQMPEIVARFNGFGGAASALVALALFWLEVVEAGADDPAAVVLGMASAITVSLSILIGVTTFTGSILAELKLRGTVKGQPRIPLRGILLTLLLAGGLAAGLGGLFALADPLTASALVAGLVAASLVAGVVLVLPIGGADMPVVISLLNSLSGLAAAATGFALENNLLIIAGTMVGAAGLILTQIMCRAMNRSLANVIVGGYGGDATGGEGAEAYESVVSSDAEEAAMVLESAQSVIIVPGYGIAAARGQHAVKELAAALGRRGVEVRFAIHPVAGRMPGHMNVVLAEAEVPYEQLFEMSEINQDFAHTDAVIVVGANDVVNPAANTQPGSPIAGMPILEVGRARRVFVIKRSLAPGYAGIKNDLFEADNTVMLFGDAKGVLDSLTAEVAEGAPAG